MTDNPMPKRPTPLPPINDRLSLPPYVFYIASTTLSDTGLRSLERLHRLGLLKAVRLYTTQTLGPRYHGTTQSIGIQDKVTVITRAKPVPMGAFTAATLDLGWLAGQGHPIDERVVLVTNQKSVQVVAEWTVKHHCDWIILPSLCDSAIDQLLTDDAIRYDQIAIRLCQELVKEQRSGQVRLSDWSQRLFDACPELTDSLRRKDLVGRRRFSEYVRVLGASRVNGDLWSYRRTLRPRPLLPDLRAVFDKENAPGRPALFLRWSNQVLAQWPALNDPKVRRWLFGTTSMEQIAKAAGLIRHGQHLTPYIAIERHSS